LKLTPRSIQHEHLFAALQTQDAQSVMRFAIAQREDRAPAKIRGQIKAVHEPQFVFRISTAVGVFRSGLEMPYRFT
jgi:hypothetical protein